VKKGEVFGRGNGGPVSEVNPLPEPIMQACYYNYSPEVVAALLDAGRALLIARMTVSILSSSISISHIPYRYSG